jgi:hypothetical protein
MAQEESLTARFLCIAVLNLMFSEPWAFWFLLESFASNTKTHMIKNKEKIDFKKT